MGPTQKETSRVFVRFISMHQDGAPLMVFNHNLINKTENKGLIKSFFVVRCSTPAAQHRSIKRLGHKAAVGGGAAGRKRLGKDTRQRRGFGRQVGAGPGWVPWHSDRRRPCECVAQIPLVQEPSPFPPAPGGHGFKASSWELDLLPALS